MAFHRHTGKVDVRPGVVGARLINGEEGFAKRLLFQRNNFECRVKPQQSAAVTPGGKWADNHVIITIITIMGNGLITMWETGAGAERWWCPRLFFKMHWMANVFVSAAVGRLGLRCYLSKTWRK